MFKVNSELSYLIEPCSDGKYLVKNMNGELTAFDLSVEEAYKIIHDWEYDLKNNPNQQQYYGGYSDGY